jgi:hypothetical protein
MTVFSLKESALDWDRDYEASLPADVGMEHRRPYSSIFDPLPIIAAIRFQPYQNDTLPSYLAKLQNWVGQFREEDRRFAFLLASKVDPLVKTPSSLA